MLHADDVEMCEEANRVTEYYLKTIAYFWQQRIWEFKMFVDKDLLIFSKKKELSLPNG